MAAPVVVKFQVEGVAQVQNAFRTIEQAALNAEKGKTAAQSKGSSDRVQISRSETKGKEAEYAKLVKQTEIWEKDATKHAKVQENERLKSVKDAANEKSRILEQAAKKEIRDRNIVNDDYLRTEAAKTKAHKAEIKKREDEEERSSERTRRRFARAIGNATASGLGQGLHSVLGVGTGMVSTAMQLGGGFSVAGAIQSRMELDKIAVQASNAAFDPTAVLENGAPDMNKRTRKSPKELSDEARRVAILTGMDATDIATGTKSYIDKASDWSGGIGNMEFMAKLAKGSNASYGEVADSLGMLRAQNKDLTMDKAQDMLAAIAAQSVRGSIGFKEVASQAAGLGKNAASFTGDQAQHQTAMIGLAQIGVKTAGRAAPTTTEISNFFDSVRIAGKNKSLGLKKSKEGLLEGSEEDVIGQVFRATHGSLDMMTAQRKDGGFQLTKFGMKLPMALMPEYVKAKEAAKARGATEDQANEAGATRVTQAAKEITSVKGNRDVVEGNFKAAMDNPAERLEAAERKLGDALATALIPQIEKFTPMLEKMVPAFASMAEKAVPAFMSVIGTLVDFATAHKGITDTIAANPIGTIMVAKVSASILQAGIGSTIGKLMESKIGPALGGLGALAVAAYAAALAIDADIADKKDRETQTVAKTITATQAAAKLKSLGKNATQKDIDEAAGIQEKLRQDTERQKGNQGLGFVEGMVLASPLGLASGGYDVGKTAVRSRAEELKRSEEELKSLSDQLLITTKNLKALGDAAGHPGIADPHNTVRNVVVKPPLKGGSGG